MLGADWVRLRRRECSLHRSTRTRTAAPDASAKSSTYINSSSGLPSPTTRRERIYHTEDQEPRGGSTSYAIFNMSKLANEQGDVRSGLMKSSKA